MIICICDFWDKKEYLSLEANESKEPKETCLQRLPSLKGIFKTESSTETEVRKEPKKRILRRLLVRVDGTQWLYLNRELEFSKAFTEKLAENPLMKTCNIIWFQLEPPKQEVIDFKWFSMIANLLWNKIECDYLMSWLSTLGGGYSALGDQFTNYAEIAGKISLEQLMLGLRLGDPFLQSRCKLYFSMSLIQTGRLRAAKKIIRREYKFACNHIEYDARLLKMCQGIWLKLQYEYGLRLERKNPGKLNPLEINNSKINQITKIS